MSSITFKEEWREKLLSRLLTYVKIYSTSDPESETTPSTPQQWDIAKYLFEEMKAIGLEDVSIDEHAYVYGFIPSNIEEKVPQIGFIAHFDSSPDFSGEGVNPIVWENYDGGDLLLNKEAGFTLSPDKFQDLKKYKGQTIITTDGTTLLSADDKAGIAEIMTAAEYLIKHPEIKHGRISIGFNPDEEIGRGAHRFNVEKFGAEWAYTLDGSEVGELEYENFNAAGAVVKFKGLSVHPGYAYGKMINANLLAAEFIQMLPFTETPSTTRGYEGFYHLMDIKGDVSESKIQYIIRDHDDQKFEARKQLMIDNQRANDHAHGDRHSALGEQVEHQAQGRDLRRHPAQVAEHDDRRAGHFNHTTVALAVVVAQGDEVLLVQLVGEKQSHQHQTHGRAKGVLHDGAEPSVHKAGRHPQHGFRSEPGGKRSGNHHRQRQATPGYRIVSGVVHASGRIQAHTNRNQQVQNDE